MSKGGQNNMRKKIVSQPALTSWEDVNAAMRLICEFECHLEELQAELNRRIDSTKAEIEKQAKPLHTKLQELEQNIKDFVTANRGELDGKTKQLGFGRTGYRLSTKLMTPKPTDILNSLRRFGMEDCISVKESINKEALRRYHTEDILKTGAYLRADDEFWYEVDRTKLQPLE